jgi:CheY-like chemotaxis protein
VASAGERGARLVKQLLAFSRRQVMRRESLDLNSLISSQLEVTRAAAAPRVNIEFTPRAGLESIYGDRSMCEQIVQNLCSNACDAMPEGGTLLIEAKNVSLNKAECVALSLLEAGAYVKLTVTDTGLGMDSDTLHRVFEPFFTTKPIEKGTGLGLSTAYGNARQHDGTISAASVPGRGSTFMVFLPASKIASAVERESAPPSLQTGTPVETVLFAEDEMPIRLLGRRILENVGYKVIEARDGKEAVKLYKENSDQIDILLFDVMMPNMDGQDAYNEICSINPGVSVVFASAYGSINIDDKIFTRENTAYVQKPFKAAELLAAVRLTLDARSAASLGHL